MLPLETKQSGGKLLHHSDLRGGGVFLEEVSRSRKRDILLGTWDVRSMYRARWIFGKWVGVETGWSWLRIGPDGGHLWIR